MTWWCSARGVTWSWSWQAYPGVWVLVGLLVFIYVWRVLRPTPPAGAPRVTKRQIASFLAGVVLMWVATDWPVGALGAGYLLFVHQLQYVLLVMVAPPLILLGTPRWVCQSMVDSPAVRPVARVVTRPLIAIVICNAVVLLTHFPELVDVLMPTQIGSFLIDIAWLLAGFLLWWPALRRVEEPNALSYPARFGYLLAATLLPAVPAAFFFFANYPIYSTYELAPPIGTLAATDDQFVGGAVMKLGSLVVVVFALTVIFFQWHAADRSPDGRIVLPRSVMDT